MRLPPGVRVCPQASTSPPIPQNAQLSMHYCPPRTHPLTHNSHLKSTIEHDISNNCYLASSIASYAENQGRDAPISAICRRLWRNGRMVRLGNARLRQRTISDGRLSQALSLASYNCKLAKKPFWQLWQLWHFGEPCRAAVVWGRGAWGGLALRAVHEATRKAVISG